MSHIIATFTPHKLSIKRMQKNLQIDITKKLT